MSRIGYLSIGKSPAVTLEQNQDVVNVSGPMGKLSVAIPSGIQITVEGDTIMVNRVKNTKQVKSLHGLTRALLANAVTGVTNGFTKQLEMHGIGYKATVEGEKLTLNVGFSHPVVFEAPTGIEFSVQKNVISIKGIDKGDVGQIAAKIREIRKPEPYKGKGIRYIGEYVRRKAGKTVKSAAS